MFWVDYATPEMISTTSRVQESTSTMSSSQTKYFIGQAPLTTITSGGSSYKTMAEGMPTPIETET